MGLRHVLATLFSLAALTTAVSASSALRDAATVGWDPALQIWGGGDAPRAIERLSQLARASDAMIHRTDIDEPTQEFWDDALDELESFDLRGFHRLLPAGRDGFHELRVRGEWREDRYEVRRAQAGQPFAVGAEGQRHALFDLEQSLRVKPTHRGKGEHDSFLIRSRLGFGVGQIAPVDLVEAATQVARITGQADPRADAKEPLQSAPTAMARVRALHPKLQPEDVETLAVVFDAFPGVFEVLGRMGELENIRDPSRGGAYQHVRLAMRARPERLKRQHGALAEYLEDLDDLSTIHLVWSDRKGRALAKLELDTETLSAKTECYLADGKLLPFTHSKVYLDEPIDPAGEDLVRTHVRVDMRVDLLGIVLRIHGVRLDVAYGLDEATVALRSSMTRAPHEIEVEGAALGFLPTRLIDAFIPGDIHGLAMDFFRVAAGGNAGKGVEMSAGLRRASGSADSVLEAEAGLEALDNRLVKMGVKMVNERVLPSDEVSEDVKRLLSDLHGAFVEDLRRFEKQMH